MLFAALGGILSERAGVFAVGLEGMMLAGAFSATIGAFATGSPFAGALLAMAGGALIGCVVAIVAVKYRADNMVAGLAVNILALGLTSYLMRIFSGGGKSVAIHLNVLQAWPVPFLSEIPLVGPLLFMHPPLTYLSVVGCSLLSFFIRKTQAGLTLRATGENPEAVFASGTDPMMVRILAVIACGAIAGLGGAVLSLQQVGTFTDGMTSGRGYLALAALIVGRWTTWKVAAACLVFGAAEALEVRLPSLGVPISSYLVQMTPYLIALAVLAGIGQSTMLPAAIGRPLNRDR
eukprot:gene10664-10736_t